MARIHFLNVKNGDCSIIEHNTGHVSVIDVCNACSETLDEKALQSLYRGLAEKGILGNFNQKDYPENPISYLEARGISSVFRFILTHPDMDHLDGIEDFFSTFAPINIWDTDNTFEKNSWNGSPYKESDWLFYKSIRDRQPTSDPKRLTLYAGSRGQYYNRNDQ